MLNARKFSGSADNPDRDLKITMAVLLPTVILSALIFAATPSQPFALLPLLGFIIWRFVPQLGSRADQAIFLGFFIVCFLIDDIAYAPWIAVTSITEVAGQLLFRSFGISGMEAFAIGFTAFIIITTRKEEKQRWLALGLHKVLLIPLAIFIPALIATAWGLATGGTFQVAMIQIRYLYLMPLWVFIGFTVLRNKEYVSRIFFWLTAVIVLKSFQGLFIYFTNRAYFIDTEYLYDHFYSAFCAPTFLLLIYYFYKHKALHMRLLNAVCFIVTAVVYEINDRRTSYAALILTVLALLALLPPALARRYGRTLLITGLLAGSFTVITWNLPVGPGAIVRYLSDNAVTGPSYRDLESANIMNALASAPLTGLGFGKEFDEVFMMPSVAAVYTRYKMIPHNVFLSMWCYGGPLTMAGVSLYFIFAIAMAGRLASAEGMEGLRLIGVLAVAFYIQYFSYVFGDLGLQVNRLELLGGICLGACARLLFERQVENGTWSATSR